MDSNPMLAGNVVALLSPLIFIPILTYAFGPQNYDYKSMAEIRLGNDEDIANAAHTDLELIPGGGGPTAEQSAAEKKKLDRAFVIAGSMTVFMTLALLILWVCKICHFLMRTKKNNRTQLLTLTIPAHADVWFRLHL